MEKEKNEHQKTIIITKCLQKYITNHIRSKEDFNYGKN